MVILPSATPLQDTFCKVSVKVNGSGPSTVIHDVVFSHWSGAAPAISNRRPLS